MDLINHSTTKKTVRKKCQKKDTISQGKIFTYFSSILKTTRTIIKLNNYIAKIRNNCEYQ